jgi:hypothetical protein
MRIAIPAVILMIASALPAWTEDPSVAAIGILLITGQADAHIDEFSMAAGLEKRSTGRTVRHQAVDGKVFSAPGVLTERIVSLADIVGARALVVSPASAGTADAFKRLREKYPEMVLIAVRPADPALAIEAWADLVLDVDWIARAYYLAKLAGQYGLREIVVAGNTGMSSDAEEAFLRRSLASATAENGLGLTILPETGNRVAAIESRIAETGGKMLFWAGNSADRLALSKAALKGGAFILEPSEPSLLVDFPALVGYDPRPDSGNYAKILKRAERAAIEAGEAGRLGTWALPPGYALTALGAEMAEAALKKRGSVKDAKLLQEKTALILSGTKFALTRRLDPATGVKASNHFLLREDIYVLGKGYLPASQTETPPKYYRQ